MIDPCGQIMGYIRFSYIKDCNFFAGGGGTCPIRWYMARPFVDKLYTNRHVFGPVHQQDEDQVQGVVGEVLHQKPTWQQWDPPGGIYSAPNAPVCGFPSEYIVGTVPNPNVAFRGPWQRACCFGPVAGCDCNPPSYYTVQARFAFGLGVIFPLVRQGTAINYLGSGPNGWTVQWQCVQGKMILSCTRGSETGAFACMAVLQGTQFQYELLNNCPGFMGFGATGTVTCF